jgi:alkylhydroperoxidase/carboxymuconolactone decarboxylase family protein YurZ
MLAANKPESVVQSHTQRALDAGATSEEIGHTLLLGINTLCFSMIMVAITWVKRSLRPLVIGFFIRL